MTDDDGTLDAEPCESLSEHISLSGGSPHGAPRPVAIPKTRAVKRDNVTLPLTGEVEQPTQIAILGCDDITMEKDYWPPRAPSRGSGAGSRRRQQTGREVDAPALLFLLDRCSTVPCQPWRRPPILPKPRRFAIALPESRSMHSPLRVRSMFFFQGARWILRRNMRLVRTLPIKRRFQDGGLPICGEMVWDGPRGDGPIVAVGN